MNNILYDTQKQVVDLIKEDDELSSVTILAENSKDIDYEISEALGQQGLVVVVMTPAANYIGNYENKMIAWEIDELTIQVVENVTVNRGKKDGVLTGQDVAIRITDWLSSPKYGRNGMFSPISYEQGEDGNLLVNKTVFKCAVYENEEEKINTTPLTFTSAGNSSVKLTKNGSPANISLEYSFDGFKTDPIPYTIGTTINLTNGQSVSMRAVSTNDTIGSSLSNYYRFFITGKILASGNIQSLLDKTCQRMDVPAYCYGYMFYNCTSLIQAPELPATTLADYCYNSMFYGCSALTQTPELPATTLASYCYREMFRTCKKLIFVSELPATTLADYCYNSMFNGCSALTRTPELKAMNLANGCYSYMFYGCTSLIQAPKLPATTLATSCYLQMFYNCSSLIQAPKLPATTLATSCYSAMFRGCQSLIQAPELKAMNLAGSCYNQMFYSCLFLTQAPELPATTLANNCYQNMFYGCKALTQAPKLPATTLATSCYNAMFDNCSALTQASELPATTLATSCYNYMFRNCTSLIHTPKLLAITLPSRSCTRMFNGCKALETASFPNLTKENVATNVVENQQAFYNAASDIEATCQDGILVINSTAV